jgi:triacylglycerol lipase
MSSPRPRLWREGRVPAEYRRLRRDPVFRGEGVPDGRGRPVVLIPGFWVDDRYMGALRGWLLRTGYVPSFSHVGLNVRCSEDAVRRLERRLEDLAHRRGARLSIVGHSRGGQFAHVLAVRRPDLVAGIVTLAAPPMNPAAISVGPAVGFSMALTLGTLRIPGFLGPSCIVGRCCRDFRRQLEIPPPPEVPWVSVYSRDDAFVDWRLMGDERATRRVEVTGSHLGLAVNAGAYRAIAEALPTFG